MIRSIVATLALAICLLTQPAAAAPCVWAHGDYLYWHAIQTNMAYGVAVDDINTFSDLNVLNQKCDIQSAFRVGLGWKPSCVCWEATFDYTRYHNTVTGSTFEPVIIASQLLAPNLGFIVGGDDLGGPAISKWRLNLDMFDLNFALPLCFCCSCRVSPYIGLRGGIIHQNQRISYVDFVDTNTAARVNATVNQRNNFSGVGPKAGFSALYPILCGISLTGDLALSAAYGEFDWMDQSIIAVQGDGVVFGTTSKSKLSRFVPMLQALIGLDWRRCWCGYTLSIAAGYEVQYYWNTWRTQNSIIQSFYVSNVGFGDLALHGLTLRFGIGY
ncbi:MAG: Lpg1974 family pore-forming outer membrane protein [Parachlamydiales bacterium]